MLNMTERRQGVWYARKPWSVQVYCMNPSPNGQWKGYANVIIETGQAIVFIRDHLPSPKQDGTEATSPRHTVYMEIIRDRIMPGSGTRGEWQVVSLPRMGNPQWNKRFSREMEIK